jgi:CSLREA domain-containing protein
MKKSIRLLALPFFFVLAASLTGCTLLDDIIAGLSRICETDPLVVTKTDDTNDGLCTADDCSLREAVVTANNCPGLQTIELPAGGYLLTRLGSGEDAADTGDLDITDDLVINGIDVPSIHGEGEDRIFEIFTPAEVELNLLLLVDGQEQLGGAIRNHSLLTMNSGAINNNHALVPPAGAGASAGGGLYNDQGANATLNGVQFLENTADEGGAIHNFALATLTIDGGLAAGNIASNHGGGLWNNFQAEAAVNSFDFLRNEADIDGAAIHNDGSLNMELNKFEENTESDQGSGLFNGPDGEAFLYEAWFTNNNSDLGGAVFNQGLLHLYQSGVNNNTALAGFGGGLYNDGAGAAMLLQNTTVSGNMIVPPGSAGGSGLYNGGGDFRIEFATFAYNNADGIMNDGGTGTMESTILASHSNGNCSGDPFNSNGYNMEDADDCGLIESSDMVSTSPLIAMLAMNGGNSLSHALNPGSPAIDSGDKDTCIAVDQRNVSRPQGAWCDRGAYEAEDGGLSGADDLTEPGEPTLVPSVTPVASVTPVPLGPISINFNADSYTLAPGECTTLRWEVQNADTVLYEGTTVPALEAEQECPTETTTYQLTAQNAAESQEAFVTIEVVLLPPRAPNNLTLNTFVCSQGKYEIELKWNDRADNEEGYRIYRDGELVADRKADTTGYVEQPPLGGPYQYGVEAYNEAGASARATINVKSCQ